MFFGIGFDQWIYPIIFAFGCFLKRFDKKIIEIDRGGGNGHSPFFL